MADTYDDDQVNADTNSDAAAPPQAGAIPTTGAQQEDDVTGSISGATGGGEPQGPKLPAQEALDTREMAFDKSGLGGAFGAAQKQKITSGRQAIVQAVLNHTLSAYGMGGPSTAGQEGSEYQGPPTDRAIPTSQDEQAPDAGPLGRGVRSMGQTIAKAGAAYSQYPSKLMGLVTGDRAMDQNTAGAIINKVNPDGSMHNESEHGLAYAVDRGGLDAGLGFMQNRVRLWDLSRSFAASALDGKNLNSAVNAANRAFKALPLGEAVQFNMGANGQVTATVNSQTEGEQPLSYNLTVPQFRELLRGQSGFGYAMMMEGPNTVLSRLASQDHEYGADPSSQGVQPGPNGAVPEDMKSLGVNQATYNMGFNLYPWASQGAQRMQFFQNQIQEKSKQGHELEVAKQQGINKTDYAKVQAGGRQEVAHENNQTKRDIAVDSNQTKQIVEDKRQAGGTARTEMRTKSFDRRTIEMLQQAREQMRSREKTTADQIKGRELDTILKNVTVMSDPDAVDAELKKRGHSLAELMPSQSQAPAAPKVGVVPGAAQARGPADIKPEQPKPKWDANAKRWVRPPATDEEAR